MQFYSSMWNYKHKGYLCLYINYFNQLYTLYNDFKICKQFFFEAYILHYSNVIIPCVPLFQPEYKEVRGEEVSLLWYTALDENTKGYITPSNIASSLTGIRGETSGLGEFTIKLFNSSG